MRQRTHFSTGWWLQPVLKDRPFSTVWSDDPVLKGVRKFCPTSLAEGRPHWFISPSAVALSSSSLKEAFWAYLCCDALLGLLG